MRAVYIHVPYCIHKCGYCDFNSHPVNEPEMETYVNALLREMEFQSEQAETLNVATVFLGGGTPTTLTTRLLESILNGVAKYFELEPNAEITLEANPATIEEGYLNKLCFAGYNRISVGAQSFQASELKFLERIHNVDEIALTTQRAREAGFDNLSLDLMFALPNQSSEQLTFSIEKALALKPDHLSTYNLTIEPGTRFYMHHKKGRLNLPEDDFQLNLFKQTIKAVTTAGYEHYEISNFAKPGKHCKHNLNYWYNRDYLGLGAGASSFLGGVRFTNEKKPSDYIRNIMNNGSAVTFSEQPDYATAMGETLMLGLRLRKGLFIESFEQRFEVSFEQTYHSVIQPLLEYNLIELTNGHLALTEKGLYLADSVILEFISESSS